MKAKLLLRFAAILMIVHFILHTLGHSQWKITNDPIKQKVVNEMTLNQFPFMGTNRSMGNYFDGYGYFTSIGLLLMGVLLWILSGVKAEEISISKKLIFVIATMLLAVSVDEFIFFFPFAAIISLISGILSFIALISFSAKE